MFAESVIGFNWIAPIAAATLLFLFAGATDATTLRGGSNGNRRQTVFLVSLHFRARGRATARSTRTHKKVEVKEVEEEEKDSQPSRARDSRHFGKPTFRSDAKNERTNERMVGRKENRSSRLNRELNAETFDPSAYATSARHLN